MTKNSFFLSNGWRILIPLWGVTLTILVFSDEIFLNLFLLVVSFIAGYIFFIPERTPFETSSSAVIAPVDGTVSRVNRVDGKTIITIEKSLFGSSAVYAPISGTVMSKRLTHGVFLDIFNPKAKYLNERANISYQWGDDILNIFLKCGFYSWGLVSFLHKERVFAGELQLQMSDGIVEVELPENVKTEVSFGDKVLGGYSVLAYGRDGIA
jgi:phosphatidylserine decarboxylase